MGNIIPFSNQDDEKNEKQMIKDDVFVIQSMVKSPITAKIKILPQEIHVLMRVLIQERNDGLNLYQEALMKKDKKEMEYWKTIQDTINSLITKLKSIDKLEEVIQDLSFIELDCLVGAIEQYLQEASLLELQMVEDEIPMVTETLKRIYENILPTYEEKRKQFDSEQQSSF